MMSIAYQSTNQSAEQIVQLEAVRLLGPVRDPLSTVLPMTVLYVLVLLTGTIGNVCTCIVIARNKYMHTATNFYLFSLAGSDLLLLILGLPQELFMLWQKYPYVFGEFICLVRGLSSETSTNASILTITAFTIERYVAICHPLKSHTMSQLPRAIKTILVIWAVSAVCALPVAWQFGIISLVIHPKELSTISRQCGIKKVLFKYGFETTAIVFFLVPITLISILYILIGINLRKSSNQIKSEPNLTPKELLTQFHEANHTDSSNLYQRNNSVSSSAQQRQIASRRSVIRMLVAVVIAFFFCYSPFHAQRVLASTINRFQLQSTTYYYYHVVLTHISGVTYYLSATINPILYQLMSRKFRIAFKDTFGFCLPCVRGNLPEITYSNIVGGVSSYKLSHTGSFYSNGSFRRSSINLEPSTPTHLKKLNSFDYLTTIVSHSPVDSDSSISSKTETPNNHDQSTQQAIHDLGTATILVSTPTSPCKSPTTQATFLSVPSFKF